MDKLKKVLRREDDGKTDGAGILERANEASTLSCGKRMKAFVFCFILGATFSFLAILLLWIPGLGIGMFAAFYTAGNVFALLRYQPRANQNRIMFLVGPCKQLKTMCAIERAFATSMMLVFMVLTVFAAFWWNNIGFALMFCAFQFLAFTWYALSYIPYAREAFLKVLRMCCPF